MTSSRKSALFRMETLWQHHTTTEVINVTSADDTVAKNTTLVPANKTVVDDSAETRDGPNLHCKSVGIDKEIGESHECSCAKSSRGFVEVTTRRGTRAREGSWLLRVVVSVFAVVSLVSLILVLVLQNRLTTNCNCQLPSEKGNSSTVSLADLYRRMKQLEDAMKETRTSLKNQSVTTNVAPSKGPCGVACTPGSPGPKWEPGSRGPKGDSGQPGHSGSMGPRGFNGSTGPAGPTGPTGPPGRVGPQGLMGLPGSNGSRGPPGYQGPQGIMGHPGASGKAGAPGNNGTCSENKSDGARGAPGPPGPPGAGNLTGCVHKLKKDVVQTPGKVASAKVILRDDEEPGMKIVAATCSTELAEEYVFESVVDPRNQVQVYRCLCKGTSKLFSKRGNKMVCLIYYWLCPTIS